ncbi:MAG: FGGY family carbohydrate kinase [Promethearchaeia archaeon]
MSIKEKKYIIAIDHGTSGIKSAIVSTHGDVIDWVFHEVPLILPEPGAAEQDPDMWWDGIIKTTKKLLSKCSVPAEDIIGICNTSQWSGTVALDKNGNHLMNAIIWMDTRGAPYMEEIHDSLIQVSGYSLWKILKWVKYTGGGPTLSGKDPISHILWLKHEQPEIYDQTEVFLEPQDYINYRLTGKIAASYASIHLNWVTDIRDPTNIKYSKKLFKILKVDQEKFPKELKWSTEVLGNLKKDIADELGLRHEVKVVMGAPDLHAAAIGSGAVEDYEGHFCVGTSDWLLCHLPHKKTDIFHNMASAPSAIKEKYLLINEQEMAGGALSFLRDKLLYHKDELLRESIINDVTNVYNQILDELSYRDDIDEEEKQEIKERIQYYKDEIMGEEDVPDIYELFDKICAEIEKEQKKAKINLAFLDFIKEKIEYHRERLQKADPLENIYKLFDEIVEKTPPGSNKLIFTPWLFGERAPVDDHTIRGGLYNISLDMTREHLIRAIFEGVAYNIRWLLHYVEKFIEKFVEEEKPEQIQDGKIMPVLNVIGGGARSDIWCQIFADVLDRKIRQVKRPIQANARGAAYIASVGLGYIKWEHISEHINIKKVFEPNPENREIYDELYEEFLNIYEITKDLYKRLNKKK